MSLLILFSILVAPHATASEYYLKTTNKAAAIKELDTNPLYSDIMQDKTRRKRALAVMRDADKAADFLLIPEIDRLEFLEDLL